MSELCTGCPNLGHINLFHFGWKPGIYQGGGRHTTYRNIEKGLFRFSNFLIVYPLNVLFIKQLIDRLCLANTWLSKEIT